MSTNQLPVFNTPEELFSALDNHISELNQHTLQGTQKSFAFEKLGGIGIGTVVTGLAANHFLAAGDRRGRMAKAAITAAGAGVGFFIGNAATNIHLTSRQNKLFRNANEPLENILGQAEQMGVMEEAVQRLGTGLRQESVFQIIPTLQKLQAYAIQQAEMQAVAPRHQPEQDAKPQQAPLNEAHQQASDKKQLEAETTLQQG